RGAAGLGPSAGTAAGRDTRAVFSRSYRALSAPAARLFRLLAAHPGPDIAAPAAASLAAWPLARTRTLLGELADAHLLMEPAPGRYTFHDLLRTYAIELAEDGPAALRRWLDHYVHTGYAAAMLLHPARDVIELDAPANGVVPERLDDHRAAFAWFA